MLFPRPLLTTMLVPSKLESIPLSPSLVTLAIISEMLPLLQLHHEERTISYLLVQIPGLSGDTQSNGIYVLKKLLGWDLCVHDFSPLCSKIYQKRQEERFHFTKNLAYILPQNGLKVSNSKIFLLIRRH